MGPVFLGVSRGRSMHVTEFVQGASVPKCVKMECGGVCWKTQNLTQVTPVKIQVESFMYYMIMEKDNQCNMIAFWIDASKRVSYIGK